MIAIDSGRDRPVFKHSRERRVWLLIPAACVVPAMLDVLQAYMQAKLDGRSARWQDLVFQGSEWLFLGTLTPITYYLARRFPLRRERWKRSLAAHVLGALVLCIGWASLGVLLGLVLHRYPAQGRLPHDYVSWILTSVPWSVFMYFAVLGCVYLLRESLASLEERLDPSRFVRVHRSTIVNLAQVREIRARVAGDSIIVLRDGTELPLSRRRRDHVADAIRQFAG